MNRVLVGCLTALLGFAGLAGCSSSSKKNVSPAQICTPSQQTCLNDATSVVCSSDGATRLPVQCGTGMKCDSTSGMCVANPSAACTAADNTCMDATTALLCTSSGVQAMPCPANTVCTGPGVCQGACTVGSSDCVDSHTLGTCTDGYHYTQTSCGSGQACVLTSSQPYDTSACVTSECQPDSGGCAPTVCGDETGGSGTASNTVSTCVPTPLGWKWQATTCLASQTCNSTQNGYCDNFPQAACASECNPGDTQCSGYLGYVTCGSDGKWGGTVTACNANAGAAEYICFSDRAGEAVCGDIACYDGNSGEVPSGSGACDASGKFHLCGDDGKVSTDATACAGGVCQVSSNRPGTYQAGACTNECQTGDQQCVPNSGSYQVCNNGVWGTTQQCAGGVSCLGYTNNAGRPATVCGECVPGTHYCNGDQLVTCQANDTWGTPANCTAGACTDVGGDAACLAECFPGKTVCGGNYVTVPGVGINAYDSSGTCTAQGTYPTSFTACTTGEYCRTGPTSAGSSPQVYGCVTCVGANNENGNPDTRCENSTDTGDADGQSGGYVEQCKADSSGWNTVANSTQCTGDNPVCYESTSIPYCHNSYWWPGLVTQTLVEKNWGVSCSQEGWGSPVSCATLGSGPVPDCCSSWCYSDSAGPVSPAYCGN